MFFVQWKLIFWLLFGQIPCVNQLVSLLRSTAVQVKQPISNGLVSSVDTVTKICRCI